MRLSVGALVVLSHLPLEPDGISVRDLTNAIFEGDCRLRLRGRINRAVAEIRTVMGRKAVYHVHHSDAPSQQKHRYGLKKELAVRRIALMQKHDIPEHLEPTLA